MKGRSMLLALAGLTVLTLVGWAGLRREQSRKAKAGKNAAQVVTITAKQQDLLVTVTQTGTIVAKNATPVIPEISGRVQWICENGIIIASGQPILRLDPLPAQERLTDLQQRYDDALVRQSATTVTGDARMTEMRLRLQRAQDDVAAFERQQKITLRQQADAIAFDEKELTFLHQEVETQRALAKKGLVPETNVERQEASYAASEAALKKKKSDYDLQVKKVDADTIQRRQNVNNTDRDMGWARSWSQRSQRMGGNEVENLSLQVERAQEDLDKTVLAAPVNGLVMLTPVGEGMGNTHLPRLGDYVSQGREVASVVIVDRLQVKIELDQTQIAGVKMGQAAEVTIEALPGRTLAGKVTAIGQTARRPPVKGWTGVSSTATFPVTIDLPPSGKTFLRPGMRADVRLVSQRLNRVIAVPVGCVFRYEKGPVVFVVDPGKAVRTPITVGGSNGDYVAVTKGLKAGARLSLNDLSEPTEKAPTAQERGSK